MDVEGLEINELGPVSGKKKQIIIGVIAILALVGILAFFFMTFKQEPLSAYFTDSVIRPGTRTVLVVEFRNLGNKDLHDVFFQITPENQEINITQPKHIEPVIGSGAYRRLEIPVVVSGNLTQGSYKISILVDAGKEKFQKNVYLEITK